MSGNFMTRREICRMAGAVLAAVSLQLSSSGSAQSPAPFENAVLRGDTIEEKCFYAPGERMRFVLRLEGHSAMQAGKWFIGWKRTGDDGESAAAAK